MSWTYASSLIFDIKMHKLKNKLNISKNNINNKHKSLFMCQESHIKIIFQYTMYNPLIHA
jgi:hypothetical protein